MKKPIFLFLLATCLTLPLVWGWSDEEYAKIKAAGAKNTDTTTDMGVLLNTATKTADLALFYHLQGNDDQANLWLAVAWQDFQQVQVPAPQVSGSSSLQPMTPAPMPATPPATSPSNSAPAMPTPQTPGTSTNQM
jgi:hypothetical protein